MHTKCTCARSEQRQESAEVGRGRRNRRLRAGKSEEERDRHVGKGHTCVCGGDGCTERQEAHIAAALHAFKTGTRPVNHVVESRRGSLRCNAGEKDVARHRRRHVVFAAKLCGRTRRANL